jgi:acylphosphatase
MSRTRRLRAVARGSVQGVGFRYTVQRRAQQLGLTGFAENLRDGSVRVEAEGSDDALDRLEAFLRQGPGMADVTDLTIERLEGTGDFDRFETR